MSKFITIDVRVSGYDGKPVRVLAICNNEDGSVLVEKIAPYLEPVRDDANTVLVTDSPSHFKNWQLAFNEKQDLAEAVRVYFERSRGSDFVQIDSALSKYDPEQIIELRKIEKTGAVHEFNSSEVSNGHIAVLLAVWASARVGLGYLVSSLVNDDSFTPDTNNTMMPFSLNWRS